MTARKTRVIIEGYGPTTIREIGPDDTAAAMATDDDATERDLAVADAFNELRETAEALRDANAVHQAASQAAREAERARSDAQDIYQNALDELDRILRDGISPGSSRSAYRY